MSGSVFEMTYSNYGRYLESNVFLQKTKPKKASEQTSSKSSLDPKPKAKPALTSVIPGQPAQGQGILSQSTMNKPQTAGAAAGGQTIPISSTKATKTSQSQNRGHFDIHDHSKTVSASGIAAGIMNATATTGTAVFKSVERSKTKGFCHHFQREDQSEIKYQPKYDLTVIRSPAFSMNKAEQVRAICDQEIHREKVEPEKEKVYAVCCKHPLFSDFYNSDPNHHHHHNHNQESNIPSSTFIANNNNNSSTNIPNLSKRGSVQQKPGRPQTSVESSKQQHNPNNLGSTIRKPSLHLNAVSSNEGTQSNNNTNNIQSGVNTAPAQRRQSQTKPMSYLLGAAEEDQTMTSLHYQRKTSMQLARSSIAQQQQQLPNGSGTPSPKASKNKKKMEILGSDLTPVEIMHYPLPQQDLISPKQRFDIQMKKQTFRPSTVKASVSRDEYRFNNFYLMKTNYKDRAHSFSSYTDRRVFEPKDNAPSYDIHKVNYDRLLTNDRHNRGNVSLEQKPVNVVPKTKHEILSRTNDVLGASVRLDYPLKDYAYYQQSGVRRPNTTNFGKSSPRKKNVFPKPDQQFRDASIDSSMNAQSIAWPGRKDLQVAYYQPV